VTAALLARNGFGAPDRIFDGGHNVLKAFGRAPSSEPLLDRLGERWDGVTELAIKPYSCVSFLHPALDALDALVSGNNLQPSEIQGVAPRFAESGSHCVDDNPLKSHCAQYVLPVRLARGRLEFIDLFVDRRETDPEVARLARATRVVRDRGELEALFPDYYAGEVTLKLRDGRRLVGRSDIARGYPETPLSDDEVRRKFRDLVGAVARAERLAALAATAANVIDAQDLHGLAALLAHPANGNDRGEDERLVLKAGTQG
jgi:2-methylcitrate dehydratase PrpD